MPILREKFQNFKPASNLKFNEKLKELQSQGKQIYNLAFGQSPFPAPEVALEYLKKHAGDNEYVAVKGILDVRKAICEFHGREDNMLNLNPDDVIIGPGSKPLIYFLMDVISGDIFITGPSWTTYRPQTMLTGHRCHVITTKIEQDWKLTPEILEKEFSQHHSDGKHHLLVFCNPDNPTGTSYTRDELKALGEIIRRYNVIVLADEIYGHLTYYGRHESIYHVIPEQTVVSSGISKWASAGGWRFGYHIYPSKLRKILDAVECLASNTYSCASVPVQRAAMELLKDPTTTQVYARHCARILKAVAEFARDTLVGVGVGVSKPMSGYYIAPDFEVIRDQLNKRGITTGKAMCEVILKESNVAIMACGPDYQLNPDSLATRLCYINFDGKFALEASMKIGLDKELPSNFVTTYCESTYDAINSLAKWVERVKSPT